MKALPTSSQIQTFRFNNCWTKINYKYFLGNRNGNEKAFKVLFVMAKICYLIFTKKPSESEAIQKLLQQAKLR